MILKRKLSGNSIVTYEFDWLLFLLAAALGIFGLFAVYSATRTLSSNTNIIIQTVAYIIGILLMLGVCFFDYEQFRPMSKYIYIGYTALLILVLILGVTGNWGARSWIRFGSIGIQPSEIAKVGFILTFSFHLSKVEDNVNRPLILLGLALHAVIPIALIMLQPDMGSAFVFVFIIAAMLFTAKLSYKYIIPLLAAGVISIPIIYNFVLADYQKQRILVFINPELDPYGSGYNVIQSKIAVGSGGLTGSGYLNGMQNQMDFLPTKYTDFIFSTVAEELGFIGAAAIVIGLTLIIFRILRVGQKADNLYGRYICTGTAAMLFFHTLENVGMCMGILPVTGIPLPFISYGGTSLVTNMLAVGLVLSVAYHNKPRQIFEVY